MERAYLCPKCKAEVILDEGSSSACCFCGTSFSENDILLRPDAGFYIHDLKRERKEVIRCLECGKDMVKGSLSSNKISHCLYCGSEELISDTGDVAVPEEGTCIPFSCSRKEAETEYLSAIKRGKFRLPGSHAKAYVEDITPAYVPCLFYDYHVYASAILSVVPYVKSPRNIGEKMLGVFLLNDFSLEKTDNSTTPYAKNVGGEMAWKGIPLCGSTAITRERFLQISPIKVSVNASEKETTSGMEKEAVILGLDRPASELSDYFGRLIRDYVKECLITTNLDNFAISSFVDSTEYQPAMSQLIYIPVWMVKIRKKDHFISWYMNAISGQSCVLETESVTEAPLPQQDQSLKSMSKKKIKKFTIDDFGGEDRLVNYRTYMNDNMASAITAEMTLNEMSADKSLLHLEKVTRRSAVIAVPEIKEAFQVEAEKALEESKLTPIPSAPVPLPAEHSPLYNMKAEAMERSLGRGQRLPQRPVNRRVGNEEQFDHSDDTHESLAVEIGLSDLPEFDPNGPNPFRKN